MEIGKIYVQRQSDGEDVYCKPTRKLKNGAYFGLVFRHYDNRFSGKAKKLSLRDWYPAPVLVENPPAKVIDKLS